MNILCLPHAFWPDNTGGISKSLLTEVEGMVAMGHRVIVVSRRLHPGAPEYEARNGYELYRYARPSMGALLANPSPLFYFTVPPVLLNRLCLQHKIDVAFVHNIFPAAGLRQSLCKIPIVYVYHASANREIALDLEHGRYGAKKWVMRAANRWVRSEEEQVLKEADTIVVKSRFMQDDMHQLYSGIDDNKIHLLPLCVDTDKYQFMRNSSFVRKELGLPQDRPILLTVRRLVGRMGIETLISSMNCVAERYPDVLLLIGGAGYLEEHLRSLIVRMNLQQNISMLGFVPEDVLPKYYQAADILIMPTLAYEGFGLSTIEALSCGTPVMATPVGGNPEVAGLLGREFLFSNNTVDAMSAGINAWLSKGIDLAMRERCRVFCEQHFSRGKVCEDLVAVLADAAALK